MLPIFSTQKFISRLFLSSVLGICTLVSAFSQQKLTTVRGIVIDGETAEPLPFVNVSFLNSNVGAVTDLDGKYQIETLFPTDSLQASYLGYTPQTFYVEPGKRNQVVDFRLVPVSLNLNTVEVVGEKGRYRKKGNPAVELIRNVIEHKEENRLAELDYYEYDKYEKIRLDLNNITEEFRRKRALRKFQFLFDYLDTSKINGKPYLPIFFRETASKVYYRDDPEAKKEYREGVKLTGLDDYANLNEGLTTVTDVLYQDLHVYDNNLLILDNQFVSPSSIIGPSYYKYYIMDTLVYKGREVIDLAFYPRSKTSWAFTGNMYISNDSSYAIVRAELSITNQINLNFVSDLQLVQEFTELGGAWFMIKDELVIDYNLTKKGRGVFGTRSVSYRNHLFNQPRDESIYHTGGNAVVDVGEVYEKSDSFWLQTRHEALTAKEQGVYDMVDTLQQVPTFRTIMEVLTLFVTGYKDIGPVDIGPVGAFYSFNEIEGFRLRIGGKTNFAFSKKLKLEGYAAYGFGDKKWKYAGAATYSFKKDHKTFPKQELRASFQHETNFVGQGLQFVSEDNFFLSFKRGSTQKMLFSDAYKLEYLHEYPFNLSYRISYEYRKRHPLGSLRFTFFDKEGHPQQLSELATEQLGIRLRYAPNQKFIQGDVYRVSIFTKYPIIAINYNLGLSNGLFTNTYSYHSLSLNIFKRFYLSFLGRADVELETGKIWGNGVPSILLHLPRANQTYAYQPDAFNMMNYLEFASDEYVILGMQHFFGGLLFNRIPLLRRLKLREVVSFKGIYGRLTERNNPNLNPNFIQFTTTPEGVPETYTLAREPYLEGSVGIYNIFKFGRIDLVKRFSYLNNPDIPQLWGVKGLGVRFRIELEF